MKGEGHFSGASLAKDESALDAILQLGSRIKEISELLANRPPALYSRDYYISSPVQIKKAFGEKWYIGSFLSFYLFVLP
jgi:hypothetical protein